MPYEIEIDPQIQNDAIFIKLKDGKEQKRFKKLPLNATKEDIETASREMILDQESIDLQEPPEPTEEELEAIQEMEKQVRSCEDVLEVNQKDYRVVKKCKPIPGPIEAPIEPEKIKDRK